MQPRIISIQLLHGNRLLLQSSQTIVETCTTTFYNESSYLVRHMPRHNVLIILLGLTHAKTQHSNNLTWSDTCQDTTFLSYYSVRHIPRHNILNIGENRNTNIGKNWNNKSCIKSSANTNGEYQVEYFLEFRLECLNTKFQKLFSQLG